MARPDDHAPSHRTTTVSECVGLWLAVSNVLSAARADDNSIAHLGRLFVEGTVRMMLDEAELKIGLDTGLAYLCWRSVIALEHEGAQPHEIEPTPWLSSRANWAVSRALRGPRDQFIKAFGLPLTTRRQQDYLAAFLAAVYLVRSATRRCHDFSDARAAFVDKQLCATVAVSLTAGVGNL